MITLINRFEVTGSTAEFERAFAATSAFFASRPGFVRHRLLRHLDRPGHYVNVADWEDETSFHQALRQKEFAAHRAALRALSDSDPELYTPLLERVSS
ncbi:antibiotic biosynthesis monooxygenase [Streptomyces sp. LP11]|uniref:Antibiotic biosynthesis monooxygenase n=1 Tax=Streptomyces pyxinicus TaxID=2970331 RepID=A0ABT2B171_9ACTN|nr:antibiotic biosynthesis monooxygenase family protein [Streptomyces sp. LP11]MCS0602257.1 antibiotic biosynthesis monooxygenase [Streptomyces sp. LP11]